MVNRALAVSELYLKQFLHLYIVFSTKGIFSYSQIISSCLYIRLKGTCSFVSRAHTSE